MFDDTDRRRFLQLAGTGTALSIAGCSALSNQDGDGEAGAGGDGGTEAEMSTVTLGVQPDEESLQELQSEISSRVESGELGRREAQQEFQTRRAELTGAAVDRFRNRSANMSVSVDETITEFGVLLVTGEPAALLDTLGFDGVNGLFPASVFEEARAQAGTGTPASGSGNDTQMA
ncbi:hypothetical protein ACOZ4L_04810 [Haloplanus ruber]|uniref:Twin-arginine translocation signal domain-containing protein n=1 Tax=Haloplanus ruber TaxID=869892 RepID=A0ABD6D1J3_9EURY|nr:hypothetical protein [Haloplanus ruber]